MSIGILDLQHCGHLPFNSVWKQREGQISELSPDIVIEMGTIEDPSP